MFDKYLSSTYSLAVTSTKSLVIALHIHITGCVSKHSKPTELKMRRQPTILLLCHLVSATCQFSCSVCYSKTLSVLGGVPETCRWAYISLPFLSGQEFFHCLSLAFLVFQHIV